MLLSDRSHISPTSLQKRFQGIFINCDLQEKSDGDSGGVSYPFDETVYLMATILDPTAAIG